MKIPTRLCVIVLLAATSASAQSIERSCLSAGRDGATVARCGCIQQAANLTLSAADQKLAASFFADPEKAQEIRHSARRSHEKFWERYQAFTEIANEFCR